VPPVKEGTALDAEREIALAGGFTFFRSSDGKFYTTDPNAPQTLQEALARRSVPYTPETHPDAFNANREPRKGFLGFMQTSMILQTAAGQGLLEILFLAG
jgi:hypothetical protein